MKYIALLRAINVGGHSVSMETLRGLFAAIGVSDVRTYIQTGNVFFESGESRETLVPKIEKHLEASLGYAVPTILVTVEELEEALATNPFVNKTITDDTRFYVLFLSKPLPEDYIPYETPKGDLEIFSAVEHVAFGVLRLINSKTTNVIPAVEKKFGISVTARFHHTTIKILEAAKK